MRLSHMLEGSLNLFENAQAQALSILNMDNNRLKEILDLGIDKKYLPFSAMLLKNGVSLDQIHSAVGDVKEFSQKNMGSVDVSNNGIKVLRKPDKVYDFMGDDIKRIPLFFRNLLEAQTTSPSADNSVEIFNQNGLVVRQINSRTEAVKYGVSQRGFPGSKGDWCISEPAIRKNLFSKYMPGYDVLIFIMDNNRNGSDPLSLVSVFYGKGGNWKITDKLNNENNIYGFGNMLKETFRNKFFENYEKYGFFINKIFGLEPKSTGDNKFEYFSEVFRGGRSYRDLTVADFIEYITFKAEHYEELADNTSSYTMSDEEFQYAMDINPNVIQQIFERGTVFSRRQMGYLFKQNKNMFLSYVRNQSLNGDIGYEEKGDLIEAVIENGMFDVCVRKGLFGDGRAANLRFLTVNAPETLPQVITDYDWSTQDLMSVVKDIDDIEIFVEIRKKVGDLPKPIFDRIFTECSVWSIGSLDDVEKIFSQDGEFMVSPKALTKELLTVGEFGTGGDGSLLQDHLESTKNICIWLIDHGADGTAKLRRLKQRYEDSPERAIKALYRHIKNFDWQEYHMRQLLAKS